VELQTRSRDALYQIMVARYYSSSLGRFMAVDPIMLDTKMEKSQSWNKYAYVRNNPKRYTDPRGTLGQDEVGPLPQALRNMGGALIPREHREAIGAFARDVSGLLNAGSMAFGGAALMAIEIPPLAATFGTAAVVMGALAVGSDFVVWIMDPLSGENVMVLVTDGVAVVIGRWAVDGLESFLMARTHKGVSSAAGAATAGALNGIEERWLGRYVSRTARRTPSGAGPVPVIEKQGTVITRDCPTKPDGPPGCP
jgi:RHS repeat-associated protein